MGITGIICEHNPLHSGHKKQLEHIRHADPEGSIVCLMSGNFVQRGMPAILSKMLRAEAAIRCGADLVLELPAIYALSSAEGFAAGGVSILSGFCDKLCFGAESADAQILLTAAQILLSEEFPFNLRQELDKGLSRLCPGSGKSIRHCVATTYGKKKILARLCTQRSCCLF